MNLELFDPVEPIERNCNLGEISHMAKSARSLARSIDENFEEKTTLDTVYLIDGSIRKVMFELVVGAPGQTAVTDIILGNDNIMKGKKGSIDEFSLGTNKELNGKKLNVTTVVTDTSRDTNLAEVTLHLQGGFKAMEYPLIKIVKEEGDTVVFTFAIEFFKL